VTSSASPGPAKRPTKVNLLPKEIGSLAHGTPPGPPVPSGTLFVLGADGGMSVEPDAGFTVVFGRNKPEVHVCVGVEDQRVSRKQGSLTWEGFRWVLTNTGRLTIRLPDSRLVLGGDRADLRPGYTPLFILAEEQEHLLEVRIATRARTADREELYASDTLDRDDVWELTPTERLVLTCLAQRYLHGDARPQPLAWEQVALELGRRLPEDRWDWKKASRIVGNVRDRLSPRVSGLRESEVPRPIGNALNHNLIMELLVTTTLTRKDLRLLKEKPPEGEGSEEARALRPLAI
jgi:hypothetical protein